MPTKKKSGGQNPAMIAKIKQMQELKRQEEERIKAEEERIKREEEEERIREEEDKRKKAEDLFLKQQKKKENINELKKQGLYLTKNQKRKLAKKRERTYCTGPCKQEINKNKEEIEIENINYVNVDNNMRSPICCVLGHVDTGKTKLLDYLRKSNIQDKEVGGITQQIGASYFPIDNIRKSTLCIEGKLDIDYNIPGLLMIDTPGHESFYNLRDRGTNLCDIAILVVDLVHGLEKQTLESIKILTDKKIPFIVALNKIDRIYDWSINNKENFLETLKKQKSHCIEELEDRILGIKNELMSQGLNTELYTRNTQMKKVISLVPISAVTGEGIPDLLALMVFLTQKWMTKKITISDNLECSVMEVKTEEGLGTTLDVILSDGALTVGDKIILAGLNGPITTDIRTLLTPQPMKELRVKNEYISHHSIKASMGIKIVSNGLEEVIAGSPIIRINKNDTEKMIESKSLEVMKDVNQILNKNNFTDNGVYVKSSTLGSLEAFLSLLKQENIPVSGAGIGKIFKKDILKSSRKLSDNKKEYSVILCFNLKESSEITKEAEKEDVKIFTGEIIYNIVDMYKKYLSDINEGKKKLQKDNVVFPCIVSMLGKKYIFNNKNPFVFGVKVNSGKLRIGTPLITAEKKVLIGKVISIEKEHKKVEFADTDSEVCIKVETNDSSITIDRHFDNNSLLYSNISRDSIDILKECYRDEMRKSDWQLVKEFKLKLHIS